MHGCRFLNRRIMSDKPIFDKLAEVWIGAMLLISATGVRIWWKNKDDKEEGQQK